MKLNTQRCISDLQIIKDHHKTRARHILYISSFNLTIRHLSGTQNVLADYLSRVRKPALVNVLTLPNISTEQDKDTYLHHLKNIIKSSETNKKLLKKQANAKILEEFYLDDSNILYKLSDKDKDPVSRDLKLAIPEHMVNQILIEAHNGTFSLHRGITYVYQELRRRYYFLNMFKKVSDHINNCDICKRLKHPKSMPIPPLTIVTVNEIFSSLTIDHIGMISKKDNTGPSERYIITCVDDFSKFLFARAVISPGMTETLDFLLNDVIPITALPGRLRSDRGGPL